jgi:hypothetical protein
VAAGHAAPVIPHATVVAKPSPIAGGAGSSAAAAAPASSPGAVQSNGTVVHHLTVAKDVPKTKKPTKPIAKNSKKAGVKKAPAKAAASAQSHASTAVQP